MPPRTVKKIISSRQKTVRHGRVKKSRTKKTVSKKISPSRRASRDAILRTLRRAALREKEKGKRSYQLARHENNPILTPREDRFWEMKATFNPGAIYADRRVHLLYRAIGGDDISVLGYAASDDGTSITERSEEPVFIPQTTKFSEPALAHGAPAELPAYCSGGGWNGGCEDPRLTLIDKKVYLMYTAFDGWGSIRIALTGIELKDFLKKRWKWDKPALISPPGEINKNWVLFPEKIHGKFAILHSISPEVMVDYFETLDELRPEEAVIRSRYDRISRTGNWDSWIRGAGPPPIKTKLGWLLFYHAMDMRDPDRYKLGAMILDAQDPTKILYRSRVPILEPDAYYENQGFKSGVVYSCGAVVKDGELYVYYGGGDSVSCVAMANLDTFLGELVRFGAPKLKTESSKISRNARR